MGSEHPSWPDMQIEKAHARLCMLVPQPSQAEECHSRSRRAVARHEVGIRVVTVGTANIWDSGRRKRVRSSRPQALVGWEALAPS